MAVVGFAEIDAEQPVIGYIDEGDIPVKVVQAADAGTLILLRGQDIQQRVNGEWVAPTVG